MTNQYDITQDKEFWYKVGVDYDEISKKDGNLLLNLVNDFISKGKKTYLEKRISLNNISKEKHDILKRIIFESHIEWLWDRNKTGPVFEVKDKKFFDSTFSTNIQEGLISENVNNFRILWKIKPYISVEGNLQTGTVIGRKFLTAESIIFRISDDKFEVRGRKGAVNWIRKEKIAGSKKFKEVKPQISTQKIIEELKNILLKENGIFNLVGIKFRETYLPNKSWLILKNSKDIREDIDKLSSDGIISPESFTDVKELVFKSIKNDKLIKIKLIHLDDGFKFEIDDKSMDEEERSETKRLLTETLGLAFDEKYDYKPQYDTKWIFHKILDNSLITYDKYFKNLPNENKEILEKIIEVKDEKSKICKSCGVRVKENQCKKCGSNDVQITKKRVIIIREEKVLELIKEKLKELKNFDYKNITYTDIKFRNNKSHLILEFFRDEKVETKKLSRHIKFYLVPITRGKIPRRANEYLENYGFILFGNSWFNRKRFVSFGYIDLYEIVFSDTNKLKEVLRSLIENSLKSIEERVVSLSSESEKRISNIESYKDSPKDFERDIFYILKRIFPLTERWGRIGKRESDGLIIFADEKDNYFIASYDPKLSETEYKLDTEEQNKAIFYILDENQFENIKLLKKGNGNINAHIFISNKFDNSKLDGFVKGIRKWYKLFEKYSDKQFKVPIIFLETRQLLELYNLYCQNFSFIRGIPEVNKTFIESVKELLTTNDWKLITNQDIEKLREKLLKVKGSVRYKEPIKLM